MIPYFNPSRGSILLGRRFQKENMSCAGHMRAVFSNEWLEILAVTGTK
jgi:hypothetical protein